MKDRTNRYIKEFQLQNPQFNDIMPNILDALSLLKECSKHNKILVCGNGGSAADSEHIAGELLKSFMLKRSLSKEKKEKLNNMFGEDGASIANSLQEGIKCIPLVSFTALNTAYMNDCNSDMLYAQLINVLGDEGDVLIAISTSGNSKNVCYAAQIAQAKGLKVIALTGNCGGKLKNISTISINSPQHMVYYIQEDHLKIYHFLCLCLESEIFEE